MSTKEPDLEGVKVPAPVACISARPPIDYHDVSRGAAGGAAGAIAGVLGAQSLGLVGGENPSILKYAGAVVLVAASTAIGGAATAWLGRKVDGFFEKDCK